MSQQLGFLVLIETHMPGPRPEVELRSRPSLQQPACARRRLRNSASSWPADAMINLSSSRGRQGREHEAPESTHRSHGLPSLSALVAISCTSSWSCKSPHHHAGLPPASAVRQGARGLHDSVLRGSVGLERHVRAQHARPCQPALQCSPWLRVREHLNLSVQGPARRCKPHSVASDQI